MTDWSSVIAESEAVIEQALQEAAAASRCTCGAVEVPGAVHLDWCPEAVGE